MLTWFERLFGFAETGYDATRSKFELRANKLIVKSTDESWTVGSFSTPSLQELRSTTDHLSSEACGLQMSVAVGDVTQLLCAVENRRATFQVASQLNCLEFVHPDVVPEDGITGYSSDKTQGPACSIACGPATVYRNYFAPVRSTSGASELGQTTFAQINNADDLLLACGAAAAGISVQSGYMQATDASLRALNDCLATTDRDALLGKLKIGVHSDVQVTSKNWGTELVTDPEQLVTQVFCSACPVSYSGAATALWEPISRVVLEAAYEATLRAAALNAERHSGQHGSRRVFLTLLGGGVFGNREEWILDAIAAAASRCSGLGLEVVIVQYAGKPDPALQRLVQRCTY